MVSLLLVDDDVELAEMLESYFVREGLQITVCHNGHQGLHALGQQSFDLMILDVMMPGLSGFEVLRAVRQKNDLPVIMLTARGDDVDKVVGLELGADDYVPKPCSPRELLARVRAILRRVRLRDSASETPQTFVVGEMMLFPEQRRVTVKGEAVPLTSTEFSLLETLARHAGQAVAKEDLSSQGLGRPLARFDRSIDVHMSSIRQKIGPLPDGRSPIQTVFRRGYMLIKE